MAEKKTKAKAKVVPREIIQDVRSVAEEKLVELKGMVDKLRKYEEVDNVQLVALGIAFIIGLAFGIAITKRRE